MLDINTLAAWGEFIGGIAVVVSLVYLASQIRQNSKLLRASAGSTLAQISLAQSSFSAQDSEMARIQLEGQTDRSTLSDVERRRFDALLHMQVKGNWHLFRFWRDGILSPQEWESAKREMTWAFQLPGQRQWWKEWRALFEDDFRDYVDDLIREGETAE